MFGDSLYAMIPYALNNDDGAIRLPPHWREVCKPNDLWERIPRKTNLNKECANGT